jgi:hypothetical protein
LWDTRLPLAGLRSGVITPHDPQQFILRAGTFIKIAGFPQ